MAQIYLKNKDFLEEILKSKELDELTPKAQEMMILLANKTIKKKRYYNVTDKDDCLQTGLLVMFTNWRCFDPEKSQNCFAYMTEVFKRGICRGFNDIYKLKGDPDRKVKTVSLQSTNDGGGIYNL